ncbi:acyl- n-acyltransferase [Trichoderma arundinaceum]|uniref:Acyl-n-acyltransferase n=1 Tax=Trichoderma arundinaceum TaxID=490622 RepID=A0A395NRI4_TRIAR|nr:acyl- n-acyltransferase [Trichoderma arundinaceum]
MAFIRSYKPSDFEGMSHICRETLNPALRPSAPGRRLAPYVWTHQYTHLSPETCFVLDDGSGRPVGYCIGCPDIPAFVAAYGSYTTAVLDASPEVTRPADLELKEPLFLPDGSVKEEVLARLAYNPHLLLVDGNADLLAEYKATMHIDLLDEFQGRGWGRQLIARFVDSVKGVPQQDGGASRGIWIGVAGDNGKVVPFYEKQGFRIKERPVASKTFFMVRDY